jgi:hypothetical protein
MSSPVASDVHVNAPLTNISIAFLQSAEGFVASRVFPNVPVKKQSDRYYTYARGDFNRDEMQKRAPGTESAGASYTVDNTPNYYCDKWAIHKDIDDDVRANEDSVLDSDRDATLFLSHKSLIRKEREWATSFFASSIWTTDKTLTNLWSTDDGTPIEDCRTGIRTVLQSTGFKPNTMVVGKLVEDKLLDHPDIIDRLKYGQTAGGPALATREALARMFGVDRFLVMEGIYNTAKEGQTASHSFIGGASALICYSAPNPGLMTPSAGYTFSWTGLLGAGAMGNRMKKFRIDQLNSDRIELELAFDMKVISADLGYFIPTAAS